MGLVLMSGRELHRAGVLTEVAGGSRSVASGAALLGLTARHMRRLVYRFRAAGAAGLVHGYRNRPSNRRRPAELRAEALRLVRSPCHVRHRGVGCARTGCG
jgi:hypothetical protein